MTVFSGAAAFIWFLFIFSSVIFSYAAVAADLVGSWFTFRKMQLPGWKGIIPFYNTYLLFDKFWNVKEFWRVIIYIGIYTGSLMIGIFLTMFGGIFSAAVYGYSVVGILFSVTGILLCIGSVVMVILALVKEYQMYRRMAAAFGLQNGWAWGLLFVPFIMLPIIGFNKKIIYYGPINQV